MWPGSANGLFHQTNFCKQICTVKTFAYFTCPNQTWMLQWVHSRHVPSVHWDYWPYIHSQDELIKDWMLSFLQYNAKEISQTIRKRGINVGYPKFEPGIKGIWQYKLSLSYLKEHLKWYINFLYNYSISCLVLEVKWLILIKSSVHSAILELDMHTSQ
jgi:hypothetical protein